MGVLLTGQQIIDFINEHKLKDVEAEIDWMAFSIDLPDGSCIDYDIDNDYVKHFKNPNSDDPNVEAISFEEATKLRNLKKGPSKAQFKRFVFPTDNSAVAFSDAIRNMCTDLGKTSTARDKCFVHYVEPGNIFAPCGYYVYAKLTREALDYILANYSFDPVHVFSKTYYIVKEEK